MDIERYMERIVKPIAEAKENAIINALNDRPRYLRRIPKMFYVKHFIEIHEQNKRPLKRPEWNSWEIKSEFRIYDRLRKKYIKIK